MRTILNVKDILEEANQKELCPRCKKIIPIVQTHVEFTKKGKVFVHKKGICTEHDYIKIIRRVQSIQMLGDDAVVLPASARKS